MIAEINIDLDVAERWLAFTLSSLLGKVAP